MLTAKLLLEHKANPNKLDYEGQTALDYATGQHVDSSIHIAMVELLLQYKADPNVSNEEQYRNSHLHKAIINNDIQSSDKALIVNLFIDNQADINAKNKDRNAPLHLAIEKRDLKVVEALIKRKADINLQNNNGHTPTPLHLTTKMEDSDIKRARITTLLAGLFAMLLAFKCNNLLKLLYWCFDCQGPILTAPFILAVFGFRGTTRTALIGMCTGVVTILIWNKWIEPSTELNGAFVAMLANGLAMLAAHYLLKQPKSAGWVGPDNDFKQIQQAGARKRAARKEAIQNAWSNRKETLAKLNPSHATIVSIGFYLALTTLATHFITPTPNRLSWFIVQLLVAAFFVGYPFIYSICKAIRGIPSGLG